MAPAKRIEDMTPEERLQSLQEFAEEKKYVRPGEGGTMPRGIGAMNAMAFGGPLTLKTAPCGYDAPLAPPSYETATGQESQAKSSKKPGPVTRWREKRREKKATKDEGAT